MATLLRDQLPWPLGADLDMQAPAAWSLPNGRRVPIDYTADRPTRVGSRAGRVRGAQNTRRSPAARVPLTLALLSPADRPIQVTADLPGFWAGSWADVRKDLAGRYPKHRWPENPAAEPPRTPQTPLTSSRWPTVRDQEHGRDSDAGEPDDGGCCVPRPAGLRLEEVPIPERRHGEALIEVEAVGICAGPQVLQRRHEVLRRHRAAGRAETDVIPGHEFVGVVAEIDDDATQRWGIAPGDRVVSEQIVPCWRCRYCRRGQYWMCAVNNVYGFKRATQGGMASHMIFPVEALVHTVSELPPAHAAFTEPLSCSLHAVERAEISFDDVVVVAGCGPIGLGMIAGTAANRRPTSSLST